MSSIQYRLQKSLDKLKKKFPETGNVELKMHAESTAYKFSQDRCINRIEICNEFLAPTKRLYALAHEFRHAIQFTRGWATEIEAHYHYYRTHLFFYNIENDANNWCIKVAPKLFKLNSKEISIFHKQYNFLQNFIKPDAKKYGLNVDWNFMFNEHYRPATTINSYINFIE